MISGFKPLVVKENFSLSLQIPVNSRLAVFVVGGGGGSDDAEPGSSGFFKYVVFEGLPNNQTVSLHLFIGEGGSSGGGDGIPTAVMLDGKEVLSAPGGGGAGRLGWSGVDTRNSGQGDGGSNGQYGSGEVLPELCEGVVLGPGVAGQEKRGGLDAGAGGVVVGGQKPTRRNTQDGEGFGAGAGEDNMKGYKGVAVVMYCEN